MVYFAALPHETPPEGWTSCRTVVNHQGGGSDAGCAGDPARVQAFADSSHWLTARLVHPVGRVRLGGDNR